MTKSSWSLIVVGISMGLAAGALMFNSDAVIAASQVLFSVAHDATLAGDGTSTAPLGVVPGGIGATQLANGSVTAAKLDANAPTLGQVLGFDGTRLAWQPSAGFRVVDSVGSEVGPLLQINTVVRRINGEAVQLRISPGGFDEGDWFPMYYTSSDCTGSPYAFNGFLPSQPSSQHSGVVVYGVGHTILTINSYSDGNGGCGVASWTTYFGTPTSFDLTTFGLVPPFKIE